MVDLRRRLFDHLVHRELEAVPGVLQTLAESEGIQHAADTILQFSVLAYSSSLHSRSAWLSALAVSELVVFDLADQSHVCAAALYAAESRIPMSQPAVVGSHEPEPATPEEVRLAVANKERDRLDRWIADLCAGGDCSMISSVAIQMPGTEGWGVIASDAALRTLERSHPDGCAQVLQIPLQEWLLDDGDLSCSTRDLVDTFLRSPDLESWHAVEVAAALASVESGSSGKPARGFEAYKFSEDFGARSRVPFIAASLGLGDDEADGIIAVFESWSAKGETWEDWSYA